MDKVRVAAYCRVSTDKTDQLNSLSNQQKYFEEYIHSHSDWQLVKIYADEGMSGTSTEKRSSFNQMIADAKDHKIDLILTKEISRFARNTVDTLEYTRQLNEYHVSVFFINNNISSSSQQGEFPLTLYSSMAQDESRVTSERVKWGQKQSMKNGVVFGRDLLGYKVKNGVLFINEEEAPIVRLIFHKFLNEGKGTHVIARELYEAGIHPKRVKKWSNTVVLRVLRNEKYVGDLLQQKTFTPNFLTHIKKYNHGERETVFLRNHHEPIINRATWEKTQAELKRRSPSKEQKSKHSNRYWCSGKLICGECGQKFINRTKKLKDGSTYKAWRCSEAAAHGAAKIDAFGSSIGCNSPSISEKALRACMRYVIHHIQISKNEIVQELSKQIKTVHEMETEHDTAPLYKKIERLNNKKSCAIDLLLDGTISKEDLKKQTEFYNQEIDSVSRQIAEAEHAERIHQKQANDIQNYLIEMDKIMNFETENGFLYQELVDKIIIFKSNYVIIYLNCVPFGVKLHYQVTGRSDNYSVVIDNIEAVPYY